MRITFGPEARWSFDRMLIFLVDYHARIQISPESPYRAGERVYCIIGRQDPDEGMFWFTELDPATSESGERFMAYIDSLHVP